jgi:hypothetical protein
MAHRPDVFNQAAFQESLRLQGCPETFISPVTSDFRLFVPIILRALGEKQILAMAEDARVELGLNEQHAAWQVAAKYMAGWADGQIEAYKKQKATAE